MGKLINIDNGGTLTDFCVFDGSQIFHTKSLTTPYDLSKCFFDGLTKLARDIYGDESKVGDLLQSTDYIRYSTTQGTNALIEGKGPRLGLIVQSEKDLDLLQSCSTTKNLLDCLVGERIGFFDLNQNDEEFESDLIKVVNSVVTQGANRIVLTVNDENFSALEAKFQRVLGRHFPTHLLGVVPISSASELSDGENFSRRSWTSLLNAFLHPAMERFLYSADHRLKSYKTRNPLLIFRNDGGSARVAKTMAIKSYSSGPRAGLEGAKALADYYGYSNLLSYDVGGTTTDIGLVKDGKLDSRTHGIVSGVEVEFPLVNIHSAGVGGSSIISVKGSEITVGPESVGAAPGPACFGLGGKSPTITDVFLLLGVLDSNTYFGGELTLDKARAEDAIMNSVGKPLGIDLYTALQKMLDAWVGKIAESLTNFAEIDSETTLAGFGGGGPLAATRIADAVGAKRVIIPGLGAVFSAFGIGFSPLSQVYRVTLTRCDKASIDSVINDLNVRAKKDMFAEGVDFNDCQISMSLLRIRKGEEEQFPLNDAQALIDLLQGSDTATLMFNVSKNIQGYQFPTLNAEQPHQAEYKTTRSILTETDSAKEIPVYSLEDLEPGAFANGPVIIEETFFTGLVDEGWQLKITGNKDLVLEKK